MGVKESFITYSDILEKNFALLFDQKLFNGTGRKKILIVLTFLMIAVLILSVTAAIVLFALFFVEYYWYW